MAKINSYVSVTTMPNASHNKTYNLCSTVHKRQSASDKSEIKKLLFEIKE